MKEVLSQRLVLVGKAPHFLSLGPRIDRGKPKGVLVLFYFVE